MRRLSLHLSVQSSWSHELQASLPCVQCFTRPEQLSSFCFSLPDAVPSPESVRNVFRNAALGQKAHTLCWERPLPYPHLPSTNWSIVTEQNPFPWSPFPKMTHLPGVSPVLQSGFWKALSVMTTNTPPHFAWIPGFHMGFFPFEMICSIESGKPKLRRDMNIISPFGKTAMWKWGFDIVKEKFPGKMDRK